MVQDTQRLLVQIEASTRRLERDMSNVRRITGRTSAGIQNQFKRSNANIEKSFARMASNSGQSIRSLSKVVQTIGAALGVRELVRYADTWTRVSNQLRAASEISGLAAGGISEINDIAARSRGGLEEIGSLYARLLRAAGPLGKTQEEVALATELVAKAFKAGGAAASEQASGILQLGQALSSGFLQGDELRSLRENAPLVAQAIADEFETTIGGLKQLGAEGELTADRVFTAIINGQRKFEGAFAETNSTIAEGFNIFRNSLIELVGAFDQGARASSGITQGFSSLAGSINVSTESAQRFGQQVNEAFTIIGEAASKTTSTFSRLSSEATAAGIDIVGPVKSAFTGLLEAIKVVIATASAAGSAIGQSMLRVVDGVVTGGVAITNAGIAAVEGVLNVIISGLQEVVKGINQVISGANKLPGLDFQPIDIPLKIELNRKENPLPERFSNSVIDAFNDQFDAVKTGLDDVEIKAGKTYSKIATRISNAGLIGGGRGEDPRTISNRSQLAQEREGITFDRPSGGSASSRNAAIDGEKELNDQRREALSIIRQSLTADEQRAQKIKEMAEIQKELAEALGSNDPLVTQLNQAVDRFESMSGYAGDIREQLRRGLDDAIFKGGKLKDVLSDAVSELGSKAFNQLLDSAFSGSSPSAGSLGSLFSGLFGGGSSVPSFATGTNFHRGGFADVGEFGKERVLLPRGSKVLNARQTQQMSSNNVSLNIDARNSQDPAATAAAIKAAVAPMVAQIARGTFADIQRRS